MCCRTAASKAAQNSREQCCLDPTVPELQFASGPVPFACGLGRLGKSCSGSAVRLSCQQSLSHSQSPTAHGWAFSDTPPDRARGEREGESSTDGEGRKPSGGRCQRVAPGAEA